MKKESRKQGFTIIEVVLVLAIAGLIFLMVFIALPALQRNQRDTQRRNDYGMLSSAITTYASNNGGKLDRLYGSGGACKEQTASKFINQDGKDPNGQDYKLKVCSFSGFAGSSGTEHSTPAEGEVWVVVKANCSGESADTSNAYPAETNSTRAFAIYGYVENGTSYCSESQ